MELFLRPLEDPNGVTWSIIWSLIILLAGVFYVIVYILGIDERFAEQVRVTSGNRLFNA